MPLSTSTQSKRTIEEYSSLPQDEDGEQPRPTTINRWRTSTVYILLIVEALLLTTIFVGLTRWSRGDDPNNYFSLRQYNKTIKYDLGLEHMEDTPQSEKFWQDLIDNNGVVSVPTAWALSTGFAPSRAHPDQADHSIYQIDAFHTIHCLYRIRSKLLGKTVHGEHEPQNTTDSDMELGHTLHCVNYIRQSLMCHADLTLQGTKNMRSFIKNEGHQCRDWESVAAWAKRMAWTGHGAWLKDNVEGKVQ